MSLYVAGDNPLYQYGASLENLMGYCERMRANYFPETLGARTVASEEAGRLGTHERKVSSRAALA